MSINKFLVIGICVLVAIAGIYWAVRTQWGFFSEPLPGDPRNATYIIENTTVILHDGKADQAIAPGSASRVVTQYFGNEAKGDFDGNGLEDTSFLLTQNSGGSGTFYYVVAALQTKRGYQGTNAILLGDRIAPQTSEWRDGRLIINYAEREKDAPMTARPSIGVSRYLKIENGQLVEIAQ